MITSNSTEIKNDEKVTLAYQNTNDSNAVSTVENQVKFGSLRELELLYLALGEEIERIFIGLNSEIKTDALKSARWNYRNPNEMYELASKIPISKNALKELKDKDGPIDKHMVHKKKHENVLISKAVSHGNIWYFKGFEEIAELKSDHLSDHVDGIKLFEALRQATLASLHLNGLQHNGVVALTNFKIDYLKYVELDEPYFIQSIPACEKDGGAMFCVFNIIQNEEIVTRGFLGAYTYRSKEIYLEKRKK